MGDLLRVECQINGREAGHGIALDFTPCNFGGIRPWFRCPTCHRRAAMLLLRGGAPFRCRQCARVAYASQSEDDIARTWRKQSKIEQQLGEHGTKPKGMHWRTFERLHDEIEACEAKRDETLAGALARLGFGLFAAL